MKNIRPVDVSKAQYDLTVELNKVITKHIRRKGDAMEIIIAATAILTATIRSIAEETTREHLANQVMQGIAKAALERGRN